MVAAPGAPSPFFAPQPAPGQMQTFSQPAAGAAPGMAQGMQGGANGGFAENVDFNIQIPARLCRFTTSKIPQTANMLAQAKIPIGGLLRPMAPCDEEDDVDVVQPGNAGIIRCKRCRTYINAFVTWLENGRRWRCNICAMLNETPSTYFCHLDENGMRRDRDQRPELSKGVVEFIAPAEYMVRPPQEPSYFFVIDVTATAVRSGMLQAAANAIRNSLDDLPGGGRTRIGFITYDNSVHYYNLAPDLSAPQMMVVSDLKELFVPLPDHLLVNLKESRSVVDSFLDNLPDMFVKNPVVSQSCLGPALKAAFTVMKQIGGKMCVFQSIMPNLGDGALRPRENPGLMGTPNEVKLLRPDIPWYNETAIEFSRQQISVDMFLFPYQYMDLSALSELPKFTAGTLNSYVGFNLETDGPRFESELVKTLTQETAFEAVMRIRCSKGMRITNFYGNFFVRGTDLLALPNCTPSSVFGFDLAHEEQAMTGTSVTIQAALLYTSSDGQRRIRVLTQALPVTSLTSELVASVDTEAVCTLLSKQAVDVTAKTTVDNARMRLQQTCVDILRFAKGGDKRTVSGYTVPSAPGQVGGGDDEKIPENLALLPLYTLAMMKNVAFRGGTDVHPDERIQALYTLNCLWVDQSRDFIYPKMFSIHEMSNAVGLPSDDEDVQTAGRDCILLPQAVNLSVERLASDGIFLLDNGVNMHMWVGRQANPNLLNSLFGTPTLENVDMNLVKVLTSGDDFTNRFNAVAEALRERDGETFVITPKVNIVREGDAHMEARFFWNLIEDRASFQGGTHSYGEFMQFVNNPSSGPTGAPPPPAPGGQRGMPPPAPPGMGRGSAPPGPPGGMPPPGPPAPGGYPVPGGPPPHGHGPPSGPLPPGPMPPQQYAAPRSAPPAYGQQQQQQQYGQAPPPPGLPQPQYGQPPQPGPPQPQYGQPPPQGHGQPPQPGPPQPQYGQPPPPGPPQQQYGQPPPPGPPQQQYGQQPPPGPPQPQYGQPPPRGPPQYGMPPPPQRGGMPPPPPPGQYNR
jgi:protein transport protein SEC24